MSTSLISLSFKHGGTLEEARSRLKTVVQEVHSRFRPMVQQTEWSTDRSRVRLDGIGFWVEMWVDTQEVHVTGDIPLLARLLGSPVVAGIKQIVQQTFQKKLI